MKDEKFFITAKNILLTYLPEPFSIKRLSLGNANTNFIVTSKTNKYFFRIYLPVKEFPRKKEEIDKEIEFTDSLVKKVFL